MLKNLAKLELEIGGRIYHFLCDQDSPTEHCKEFLFQCLKYIGMIEDGIKKAQEEAKIMEENKQEEQPQEQGQEHAEAS